MVPGDSVPALRALIEERMRHRSIADLERAMGVRDLMQKLDSAAHSGRSPRFDIVEKLLEEVDCTLGEIIAASLIDGGYGHLMPPMTREAALAARELLHSPPETQALILSFLRWLEVAEHRSS